MSFAPQRVQSSRGEWRLRCPQHCVHCFSTGESILKELKMSLRMKKHSKGWYDEVNNNDKNYNDDDSGNDGENDIDDYDDERGSEYETCTPPWQRHHQPSGLSGQVNSEFHDSSGNLRNFFPAPAFPLNLPLKSFILPWFTSNHRDKSFLLIVKLWIGCLWGLGTNSLEQKCFHFDQILAMWWPGIIWPS